MARRYDIEKLLVIADGVASCLTPIVAIAIRLFLFSCSYHKMMVAKYCSKWEKSQEAKWRSAAEQRLVCELERAMDVDLFLEMQGRWAKEIPHCLVILHEMFCHAASEGQKETECMCCHGHQSSIPEPNPEADQSAMELVGYQASRKEIRDVYHSVYLLRRPPGSPLVGNQEGEGLYRIYSPPCRLGYRGRRTPPKLKI